MIIQIIGFIGLFFFVLSFQQVKRNRILALMVIGQGIFLVHFILLGAWTAVGMNSFPHPFWFAYNLIKGSWAGVACEIFILSSVIIAIIRYDILKKNSLDPEKI